MFLPGLGSGMQMSWHWPSMCGVQRKFWRSCRDSQVKGKSSEPGAGTWVLTLLLLLILCENLGESLPLRVSEEYKLAFSRCCDPKQPVPVDPDLPLCSLAEGAAFRNPWGLFSQPHQAIAQTYIASISPHATKRKHGVKL